MFYTTFWNMILLLHFLLYLLSSYEGLFLYFFNSSYINRRDIYYARKQINDQH